MRRAAWSGLLIIILFGLGIASPAWSQSVDLRVRAVTAGLVSVAPGGSRTLAFGVENAGADTVAVEAEVQVPPGWRSLLPDGPLVLAPGVRVTRLAGFAAPSQAAAGRYVVGLSVRAPDGTTAADSVAVEVEAVRTLGFELIARPPFAVAGTPMTLTYRVRNTGNVEDEVRFEVEAGSPTGGRATPTRARLAPGESVDVRVEAAPPAALAGRMPFSVTLRARLGDERLGRTAYVDALPRAASGAAWRPALPVQVEFSAGGTRWPVGPQVEVNGRGRPFDDRPDLLRFRLRGPNRDDVVLGRRDEGFVTYEGPWGEVRVGDLSYRLTHLTQYARSAFGAEGRYEWSRYFVGGMANRRRRSSFEQPQGAVYAGVRPWEDAEVSARFFRTSGEPGGEVATLLLRDESREAADVEAEIGTGVGGGRAYRMTLDGDHSWGSVNVQGERISPRYPTASRGTESASVDLRFRPSSSIEVQARARHAGRRLEAGEGLVQENQGIRGGARLGFDVGSYPVQTALYGTLDRRASGGARGTERALEAQSSMSIPGGRVWGTARFGRTETQGETFDAHRFTLYANRYAARGLSLGASATYFSGRTLYFPAEQEQLTLALSAGTTLTPRTRASLSLSGTRQETNTRRYFLSSYLSVEHLFANQHRLQLRVRRSDTFTPRSGRGTFSIRYIVPIDVPGPRTRLRGRVRGVVYDEVTGRPVSDVPVLLGDDAVVTGEGGRFAFPAQRPDTLLLSLDDSATPEGRVTRQTLPERVVLRAGEEVVRRIDLIRSGSLVVYVAEMAFEGAGRLGEQRGDLVERGGLGGAGVAVLRGDSVVVRRFTGADGRASFEDLRPGPYRVTLLRGTVPEGALVAPDTLHLDVLPGEIVRDTLRVSPRRRVIRFIQGGQIGGDDDGNDAPDVPAPEDPAPEDQPTGDDEPAAADAGERTFVVTRSTPTLYSVARAVYGDPFLWPRLWNANRDRVPRPERLYAGQVLRVPPAGPLTPDERALLGGDAPDGADADGGERTFVVTAATPTLFAVARAVYGDPLLWPKLWHANRAELPTPGALRVGQVLRVPPEAPLTAAERALRDAYEEAP